MLKPWRESVVGQSAPSSGRRSCCSFLLCASGVLMLVGCGQKVPTFGELTGQTKTEPAPMTPQPPPAAAPAAQNTAAEPTPEEVIVAFHKIPRGEIGDGDVRSLAALKSGTEGLSELELGGSKITSAGLEGIENLSHLKRLDLNSTQVDDAGMAHLGKAPALEEVTLTGTKVTAKGLAELPNIKTLRKLVLENAALEPSAYVAIGNIQSLKALIIGQSSFNDESCRYINNLKGLEELRINSTTVTDRGLADLKGLVNLKILVLASNPMNGEGLLALTKAGTLKNLDLLNLYRVPVTDAAGRALMQLKSLRELFLNETNMRDQDMVIFRGMTQLRHLHLGNIQSFNGSGFTYLRACKYLETVDINGCKNVTDQQLGLLKDNKELKLIIANGTGISSQGAAAMKKFVPECVIQSDR